MNTRGSGVVLACVRNVVLVCCCSSTGFSLRMPCISNGGYRGGTALNGKIANHRKSLPITRGSILPLLLLLLLLSRKKSNTKMVYRSALRRCTRSDETQARRRAMPLCQKKMQAKG